MRIATHAFKTSPVNSILSEGKVLPLAIRRNEIMLNYALKILSHPHNQVFDLLKCTKVGLSNSNSKQAFNTRINKVLQHYKIQSPKPLTHETIKLCPSENTLDKLIINTTNNKIKNEEEYLKLYPEYQHIFTAHYKDKEASGCAVLLPNDEQILNKIPNWITKETCQGIAVLNAIDYAQKTEGQFIIFTDLTVLNKHQTPLNNTIVNKILNAIVKNGNKLLISTTLPLAHKSIKTLEMAQTASKLNFPIANRIITNKDFKNLIKIKIQNAWNQQWKSSQKTYLHDIRKSTYETNPAMHLSRRDQTIITRLRIGHTLLTHQHLFTKDPKPTCDKCGSKITVQHILVQCPKFCEERKKFKINNKTIGDLLNTTIMCKKVLKFIDGINVRNQL